MDIAIIGTSSSVSKEGYARALSKLDGVNIVANASLGSSHGVLISYMLEKLDKVRIDVLIIDVCLNEQRAMILKKYNIKLINDVFLYTLSWCAKANVIPMYLISPEDSPSKKESELVRNLYIAACEKHSIPYFDGNSFIDDHSKLTGVPKEDLFIDWAHTKQEISHHLALAIKASLPPLLASAKKTRRLSLVRKHISVPMKGDKLEARSSRLLSGTVRRLEPHDGETIHIPPCSEVFGLVLNAGATTGTLHLGKFTKRLDNVLYRTAPFRLVAWVLLKPIFSLSGKLSVGVSPSTISSDAETNDHIDTSADLGDLTEHVVELSALIVRKLPFPRQTISILGYDLNIYSAIRKSAAAA